MRKKTGKGMTEEEIKKFVEKFMPAYKGYLPSLYSGANGIAKDVMMIKVNENRDPVDSKVFSA